VGDLAGIAEAAAVERLAVLGAFHPGPEHGLPGGTLVLLGPDKGFWSHVIAGLEFSDGAPDPMDRWSARVIGRLADAAGGSALFPFGEPVRPFVSWALASGHAWVSPVGLLVHDRAGLMVSFRGAILLSERLELAPTPSCPCETCAARPCLAACPAGALTEEGYALAACHAYLDTAEGQDCMTQGCRVRRSCPISAGAGRDPEQSAYHMRQFH
jgi:hypothetical protein